MRRTRGLTRSDDLNSGIEPLNANVQDTQRGFVEDEVEEGQEEGHDRRTNRLSEKQIPRETVMRRTDTSAAAE